MTLMDGWVHFGVLGLIWEHAHTYTNVCVDLEPGTWAMVMTVSVIGMAGMKTSS